MKTIGITRQKTRKEQLSPWSSVIEKLLIVELTKKFPALLLRSQESGVDPIHFKQYSPHYILI
jgi:hypothetical protein